MSFLDGIFGLDPLRDALNMLYNDSSNDKQDIEVMRLTKDGKIVYVAVVKCPGLERKDLSIEFTENEGSYPAIRVQGETKTPFGTYKINVGAMVCLRERVHMREDGTIYKNGILYIYLEPEDEAKTRTYDPNNPDFI